MTDQAAPTEPTPADPSPADLSVVIPAHDAADTLGEAIDTILGDHEPAPVVIVVDDRSSDATAEVAAACGAIVLVADGTGPGAARNTGVAAVTTEFLAFCDADDWWHPDRLGDHLRRLTDPASDPAVDLVLGHTRYHLDASVDQTVHDELLTGHRFDNDELTVVIPSFGAATMRTTAFHRAGWIDASLANYEDYEWFYRARDLGLTMVTSDRVAQIRRITEHSTSRTNPPAPRDLLAVMQRSVRRRRELGLRPADAAEISRLGR